MPSLAEIMASTDIKYLASLLLSKVTIFPSAPLITIEGFNSPDLDEFFQSITTFWLIPVDSSETSPILTPSTKSSNATIPEASVIIGIV